MAASRYWPIVSFVAGELSPLLRGRFDLAQYRQGCERVENFHPIAHGGLMRRAGTQRMGNAHTSGGRARLIAFHGTDGESFIVELGTSAARIYHDGGAESVVTLASPYSVSEGRDVDYAQADDTMILVHPLYPPYRLTRHAAGEWTLDAVPFVVPPTTEGQLFASNYFTVGSSGTGSVTFTAPASYASDIGRVIRRGSGYGVITAAPTGTTYTVNVSVGFAASAALFVMEGSPQMTMTPSATGPVGATITMTGSAAWPTSYGNRVVRINGGSVLLTTFNAPNVMNAEVLSELSSTTAAVAGTWVMETPEWDAGYPRAVTFHDQRLVFGGWARNPQGVAFSGIGLFYDFRRTELATDSLTYRMAVKDAAAIQYLISDFDLVAMTDKAEIVLERTNDSAISATNPPRTRRRSNYGCARIRPVEVDGEVLFVSHDQRRIVAMFYEAQSGQYQVRDITKLAEHIPREGQGFRDLAFCRSPVPTIYAPMENGVMAACTYDMTEGVIGWWRYITAGEVHSLAVCDGNRQDRLWMNTERAIGWFIERADPYRYMRSDDSLAANETGQFGLHVDCAEVTQPVSTINEVPANPAANGVSQRVIADGYDAGDHVPAGGIITLPGAYWTFWAAAGYAYTSLVRPLPPELATAQGTGMGRPVRKGPATVKVYRTLGGLMRAAGSSAQFVLTPAVAWPVGGSTVPLPFVTGEVGVDLSGWDKDKAPFEIVQDKAMPMTVISVTDVMSNSP